MIVLKHLCREFNIDPAKARALLREKTGYAPTKKRWRWEEGSKELAEARKILKEAKSE